MKKLLSVFMLFLMTVGFCISQDKGTTSFGPAPVSKAGFVIPQITSPNNALSRGFVYISSTTHQLNKQFMGNTTLTPIGTAQTYGFPGAAVWHQPSGKLYVNDQLTPFGLYTVDTSTGNKTLVVNITGVTLTNLTGMTWDGTQMWGIQSSLSASQIGTINLTTGVFTPVGSPSTTCAGAIMLNAAPNGTLFAIDLILDNLYKFNKTTGVATLVGPLGLNANFGQDGAFDADGTYYWACYNATAAGQAQLRIIDTTSGSSTLVGTYTGQAATLAVKPYITAPPPMIDPDKACVYLGSTAPFYGFYGHAAAVLGDTMYVAGGSGAGAGSTTVYRYAINTGIISTGVPLPTTKCSGVLVAAGNALYYIGGSASTISGTAEGLSYKYTPTGGWSTIASTPNPKTGAVGMAWGDSVIFIVGGGWTTYSNTVEFYRIGSNTWGTSTPFTTGRRSHAAGLNNGKIVVCCGYSGTFLNNTQIGTIGANASTITWTTGPTVPFPSIITGTSRPGGTAVNGKFYLVTGEVTGTISGVGHDTVYVLDLNTNTWTSARITGRAPQAASNYWAAVCYKVLPSGKIKILIPGGSITSATGGLCALQIDPCTITGVEQTGEIPADYRLSQNYPNPFNPVTKINFALPKSGFVSLKIYNILGKEVATLVNEFKKEGSYSVDFNASELSSGTYIYKITVNNFTEVKKMVLLK